MDSRLAILLLLVIASSSLVTSQKYFDFNSYLKFSKGRNILTGGDVRLVVSFKYCNPKGILLYQNSPNGYFAIGINNQKIYVEWKMSNIVVELYIGDGSLQPNTTYVVTILNLTTRFNTTATINGNPATVDYLITLNDRLNLYDIQSEIYVGGFVDVSLLPVNTERLSAYLVICLDYVETAYGRIALETADQNVGVSDGCPSDFCAPPTVITTTSSNSYVQMNYTVKARTRTQISLKFRTRASNGLLFYIGGPAYLTLYLTRGGQLGLGLNTKASDPGVFASSTLAGFNDGNWKYVKVTRVDNTANLTNEQGYLLISTTFGASDVSGFNLNAESIMIAGAPSPLTFLPVDAQVSIPGCFEAPRFVSHGTLNEPAALLNYETQIKDSRSITVGQCNPWQTCSPPCQPDNQICNLICDCSPGYYAAAQNPLVCNNINDCLPNPCQNAGTCHDLLLDYRCDCLTPYTGKNCTQINFCISNLCMNNGTCTNLPTGFFCSCAQGFSGPYCEQDINECSSNPCKNGATCSNEIGRYTCICPPGFNGINCESDVNECINSICFNGGSCQNTPGSFFCQCATGWTGQFCQTSTNKCLSNPCRNDGTCVDDVNRFICNCVPGFAGTVCETDINECSSQPCKNGGICTDGRNLYTCSCLPGFTGINCDTDIDECLSNPCRNGAVCYNFVNLFTCQCRPGYTGTTCDIDINECASSPCRNGGTCVDGPAQFTCICSSGWTGLQCDQDINECQSSPCLNGGSCSNEVGRYTCNCILGYTGLNCGTNINECASSPCLNGGTCIDGINSFACRCAPGFVGTTCATDLDECSSNPCQNGATCFNQQNSYLCSCVPGYTGTQCQTEINECDSSPCMNGGVCNNRINSFYCQCSAGFIGQRCEINYNECSSNPCMNGVCIDGINSFSCTCFPGWQGTLCNQDVNECLSQPCLNGGTCDNLQNFFRCRCAAGFEGTFCETNTNDCLSNRCVNGATCIDGIASYTCSCNPGWTGQFCDQDFDECSSNPCQNNATCSNFFNRFYCTCPAGFTGPTCSVDIDECSLGVCVNVISCQNTYGSYNCQCKSGYSGRNCDSVSNPCASNPCNFGGTCEVRNDAAYCICLPDYMGLRCEAIIRWCNYSYPCGNNAVCQDKPLGGYLCFCKSGFTGSTCMENINECSSNPCFNGGTCLDLANGYNCTCMPGYTGESCRVDIDECSSQPCQNGGICRQPTVNMYQCTCAPGYAGVNCEKIIDNCLSGPCQTWQICVNSVNNFTCTCSTGFTGDRCTERVDKCFSQPCQNGGTCQMQLTGGFLCQCPFPWTGLVCQIKTDACYPNPCLFMGTCIRNPSVIPSGYTCVCMPGFIGERCQGDIYNCLSYPCQNGGQCTEWLNGTNGFACNCPSGFSGSLCQFTSSVTGACSSFPCLNNGSCTTTNIGYQCLCSTGWTGSRCENDIDECVVQHPCLNEGYCQNTLGSFACQCVLGWTGVTCNIPPLSPCNSNPCPGQVCQAYDNGSYVCCPFGSICPSPCSSNPCQNNGTCQALTPSNFSCTCLSIYAGSRCEILLVATFGGRNLVQIPGSSVRRKRQTTDQSAGNTTNVEFFYKTTVGNGLILFAAGKQTNDRPDYLLVELHNNTLRVAAGFSTQEIERSLPIENSLSLARAVKVTLSVQGGYFGISLTPCYELTCGFTVSEPYPSLMLDGPLFLGGTTNLSPYMRSRIRSMLMFRGCLGNFSINGRLQSILYTVPVPVKLLAADVTGPPTPGCNDNHEMCSAAYCQNGGQCIDTWETKICQCGPSYSGQFCEHQILVHIPGSATFDLMMTGTGAQSQINISFQFSTNSSSGFVFYTLSSPFLALFFEDWNFFLASSNIPRQNISTSRDGSWNVINLSINSSGVYSMVKPVNNDSPPSNNFLPFLNTPFTGWSHLYFGSLQQDSSSDMWRINFPNIAASFIGCLRNLNVNSESIDWTRLSGNLDPKVLELTKLCPREEKCLTNPCSNRGACSSSWLGYKCSCNPVYAGESCSSASEVTYTGVASYTLVSVNSSEYSFGRFISWRMRTRQANTTCFILLRFPPSPAYLCIRISSGNLLIKTRNDGNEFLNSPTKFRVNTGEWTNVNIASFDSNYTVIVNNDSQVIQTNTKMYVSTRSSLTFVNFGNEPNMPSFEPSSWFKGCISEVKFNEDFFVSLLNYSSDQIASVASGSVSDICSSDSVCFNNTCANGGTCDDLWNQFSCTCALGWSGDTCTIQVSTPQPCTCQNGAQCQWINNNIFCNCINGWTGKNCEYRLSCVSAPCQNGGSCVDNQLGNFSCSCLPDFTGTLCDVYKPCASNPCQNGGQCTKGDGKFNCTCVGPFTGEICTCFPGSCLNGGKCMAVTISDFPTYTCQCSDVNYGYFCEFYDSCKIDACLNQMNCAGLIGNYSCPCTLTGTTPNMCITLSTICPNNKNFCLNNGSCFLNSSTSTMYCKCLPGFSGRNCNETVNPCSSNPCLNDGICTLLGKSISNQTYNCTCKSNFTGSNCELKSPCFSSPCQSNETCAPSQDSTGFVCSSSSPQIRAVEMQYPNTGLAIGLGVGIPLALLTVLAGYYFYQREQKLRGNYRPQETESNASNSTTLSSDTPPYTVSTGRNNVLI